MQQSENDVFLVEVDDGEADDRFILISKNTIYTLDTSNLKYKRSKKGKKIVRFGAPSTYQYVLYWRNYEF